MTDSVQVFPAGYRLTDSQTGAPLAGASIEFYDAGTTTPKTIYGDPDLQSIIGTFGVIITDSLGYPTSDNGSTKTLIYVGTASYKIIIRSSTGTVIAEHDNIKGAIEVFDPATLTVNSSTPIFARSTAYPVVVADQNKVIPVDCAGGAVTVTLPSVSEVGMFNGWAVTVQHAGGTTANVVTIQTTSSQLLYYGKTNLGTSVSLLQNGEQMTFINNGSAWIIAPRVQIFTPAGTIMMYGATLPPVGWLSCDGSVISRTTYSALFTAIGTTFGTGDGTTTFKIPDLRGYFVRGLGTNADGTASAALNTKQADDFKAHDHGSLTTNGPKCYSMSGGTGVTVTGLGTVLSHEGSAHTGGTTNNYQLNGPVSIPSNGGTETRPKNQSLLYIIKY